MTFANEVSPQGIQDPFLIEKDEEIETVENSTPIIDDDVEHYIENCQDPDFIENEMIYDDIDGLEEMLLDVSITFVPDLVITVWKIHDFSITQFLREINFEDSRSAQSTIFTHLEGLNFDFHEFLHFLKVEIDQINKFRAIKIAKPAVLNL